MTTRRNTTDEFTILLDHSPLGIVLTNMEHEFIYVNPSFYNMLGYTEAEILTKKVADLTHQDSIPESIHAIKSAFSGSGAQKLQKKYLHKDGSIIHAITRISPVFDDEGKPLYQCTNVEDITEKVRAQEKLDDTKKRAETIIETAMEAIIEFDSAGIICSCNQMTEKLFCASKYTILSKNISSFIVSTSKQVPDIALWLQQQDKESLHELHEDFYGQHTNGTLFPIEFSITSYFDDGNQYYCLFVRDITERKKSEKQQRYFATHDDLTDLPNRALLSEILEQVMASSSRVDYNHALLFLDLDNFKKNQ